MNEFDFGIPLEEYVDGVRYKWPIIQLMIMMLINDEEACVEVILLLLRYGASISLFNAANNHTVLYMAMINEKWALAAIILSHGSCMPNLEHRQYYQLCGQILEDSKGAVDLLKHIRDVDFSQMPEITPLRLAVREGSSNIVKLLLAMGANPNVKEMPWITSILQDAIMADFEGEMIAELLSYGAEVDPIRLDKAKMMMPTPLMIAAKEGLSDLTKILLKHNPNVDLQDSLGYTALHKACQNLNFECVELLLRHRANANARSSCGDTPFIFATFGKSYRIMKILLQYGANVNAHWNGYETNGNEYPLQSACKNMDDKAVNSLTRSGAYLNIMNVYGQNLLHYSAQNQYVLIELCVSDDF